MDESRLKFELPGFRFHPTEEELLEFYLKNTILGKKLHFDIIGVVNIYHHDPWALPGLAKIGEREWYFFVPRDRKHGSGGRPNRTTQHGFWKATGSDRKIVSLSDPKRIIGLKKTLVFYNGRAPRGNKTDWVMNEYRLPDTFPPHKDIVLCKIYRKATSLKVLEQRAVEEEMKTINVAIPSTPSSPPISLMDTTISFCSQHEDLVPPTHSVDCKKEDEEEPPLLFNDIQTAAASSSETKSSSTTTLHLPIAIEKLELQLPKFSMDLTQDPLWTPLCSPWLDNWLTSYANVLNF